MIDIYSVIVTFFREGGFFIYPIAVVLAIGLAISVERWVFLTRERLRNVRAFNEFLPLLRATDVEKMQMYSRDNQAPVTRIIGCGLDMMKVSTQRADVENAMSEGMLETMPRLEKRTGYLAVLANIATLLGLLGTIIGLIGAFTAVANADPAEKSTLLSVSISVAMNTTAFGLIAAIPLLVLHAILQNKTAAIVTSIEMSAVKFLNIMTLHRFIEAGSPRTTDTVSPLASAAVEKVSKKAAKATPKRSKAKAVFTSSAPLSATNTFAQENTAAATPKQPAAMAQPAAPVAQQSTPEPQAQVVQQQAAPPQQPVQPVAPQTMVPAPQPAAPAAQTAVPTQPAQNQQAPLDPVPAQPVVEQAQQPVVAQVAPEQQQVHAQPLTQADPNAVVPTATQVDDSAPEVVVPSTINPLPAS